MKILTAKQIKEADAYTISNEPVKSIDLMERAANGCFEWIIRKYTGDFSFKIFCGVGNNGGDGLVIARKLAGLGYKAEVFIVRFSDKCTDDFLTNEKRLLESGINAKNISEYSINENFFSENHEKTIIIDAIFGSGLSRPVNGFASRVIKKINQLKKEIVSIDIPSGLFCEDNTSNVRENIIKASYTLTLELPKLAFMFPENGDYVGEWQIISIGLHKKSLSEIPCKNFFTTGSTIKKILKPRKKFSHKGNFGHALIISGSYGKIGAATLAIKACLRAGAGLVSSHIPKCGYEIVQAINPEAMAMVDDSENFISSLPKIEKFNAIGVGPGIGTEKQTANVLKLLIQNSSIPLVIDADALNIISENKTWYSFIPKQSILTPHPKEFERLAGKSSSDFERFQKQIDFAKKFGLYVVLKGGHTSIACPEGECFFNSTGNPGMATGGTGDVLTGIITSMLARGYSPKEAGIAGVFIHGLAGDLASEKKGQEAMTASDIIENLGEAFLSLAR